MIQTASPISPHARRLRDATVLAALIAYCAWWIFWLVRGQFPPAPLHALTGLPAPSSGCIRALQALLHGDIIASFLWNPFAVPITLLLAINFLWLMMLLIRRRPLRLPTTIFSIWAIMLVAAWIAKFVLGSQYW